MNWCPVPPIGVGSTVYRKVMNEWRVFFHFWNVAPVLDRVLGKWNLVQSSWWVVQRAWQVREVKLFMSRKLEILAAKQRTRIGTNHSFCKRNNKMLLIASFNILKVYFLLSWSTDLNFNIKNCTAVIYSLSIAAHYYSSFSKINLPVLFLPPVFDYAYRDYILSWYIPLSRDEGQLYSMLSEDWWQMIGQLRSRLADIDLVNVVCYDSIRILHTHFTDLKAASARYTNALTYKSFVAQCSDSLLFHWNMFQLWLGTAKIFSSPQSPNTPPSFYVCRWGEIMAIQFSVNNIKILLSHFLCLQAASVRCT